MRILRFRNVSLILAASLLLALPMSAGAQTVNFETVPVGQSSAVTPVRLTFPANSTPASLIATTQGATGQDFAIVSGGSCGVDVNVAAGQSCTVNMTFTPKFAGQRSGAVVALDPSGVILAMTYVYGNGTGPQVNIQSEWLYYYDPSYANSYPVSTVTVANGFSHPNVAVDGSGNIYVADWGDNRIQKIPAACMSAACSVTVSDSVFTPSAVAVDGAGNLFVTEASNGDVKEIPLGCQSPSCLETVGTGFNGPFGLFVDASGNIFVADTYNNAIKEVVAAGGYTTTNTLASGLDLPWSVVVDSSGNLFAAEGGDQCVVFIPGTCSSINTSIVEIPAAGDYKTVNTLGGGFGKPFGLAIDGSGNVYEADFGDSCSNEFTAGSEYTTSRSLCSHNFPIFPEGIAAESNGNLILNDVIFGDVYKMDFADLPSILFQTATLEGTTDTHDGTQVFAVVNNGTAPLTLSAMTLSDPSFQFDSKITTCSTSNPVAAGGSCNLGVTFTPDTTGPISATLTLTDNNLNQSPATQVLPITAVALPPVPVLLTNPPSSTTSASATFTFSDTQTPITFVCSIDNLPFSACASPTVYSAVSGGAHVFQVKAVDALGNLSLPAVYNWTVNSVGPPAPAITSGPPPITVNPTAVFSFTDAQAGVSFLCSLDGAAFASCTSGVSYPNLTPVGINNWGDFHSFAVEAQDNAGNASPQTTQTWMVRQPAHGFNTNPVNFGTLAVGQTSAAQPVTFTFTASDSIATIDATTMGITGLDYAVSDPGTCAVNTPVSNGSTCTLQATFSPRLAGQRKGGVVLLDAAGNGIGEAYLEGTGTAPQVTFTPYSTVWYNLLPPQNNADPGKNLVADVTDVTVDGAGDVYVTEGAEDSADGTVGVNIGAVLEFPAGCTTASCSQVTVTSLNSVGNGGSGPTIITPPGLVMDGTGLLWVNNFILSPFQWSTVGSWNNAQCWDSFIYDNSSIYAYGYRPGIDGAGDCSVIAYGGMLFLYSSQLGPVSGSSVDSAPSFDFSTNTPSMAVDPGGNIFVADAGNNAIKEVLASSNFTIDRTVGSGFNNPAGVASDALGNIYVSDAGNNALKEMTAASGYTQILTLATFDPKVLTLGNLTVDGPGNIYIANVNP